MSNAEQDSNDVAIVGAGIAGLTLGLCLRRRGRGAVIIEQAPAFEMMGAGLQLAPNATRILHRLGFSSALREHSVAIKRRIVRTPSGEIIKIEPLGEEVEKRYDAPYVAIHRGVLHRLLASEWGPDGLHLGDRVAKVRQLPYEAEIERVSGRRDRFPLVVGADGIKSVVRGLVARDRPIYSGQSLFRTVLSADRFGMTDDEAEVQVWAGHDRHCVVYPLGMGRINLVAAFPVAAPDGESWQIAGDINEVRSAFVGWDPKLLKLLNGIESAPQWAIHDRDAIDHWSTPNVTLVGDAAHPMVPFMAQGANQAIEDAASLAVCLWNHPAERPAAAISAYESLRVRRTAAVQTFSRSNVTTSAAVPEVTRSGDDPLARWDWLYGHDAEMAALVADVPEPTALLEQVTA